MSITPTNTVSIQQFINQVKSADSSKQKEIRLDIETAKQLAFTLGIVMSRLEGSMEESISKMLSEKKESSEVITVKLDGGTGW